MEMLTNLCASFLIDLNVKERKDSSLVLTSNMMKYGWPESTDEDAHLFAKIQKKS